MSKEDFVGLWNRLHAKQDVHYIYEQIELNYAAKERHYHTLEHVNECLQELKSTGKPDDALEFAIWFHDLIYNPRENDNELRSAEIAKDICIKGGLSKPFSHDVYSLILATKHDAGLIRPRDMLIADIDLSIFGKSWERFMEYEHQIRKEYLFVPRDAYEEKRKDVLGEFAKRDRIYLTDHFHEKYELKARDNLKMLIDDTIYWLNFE